MKCHFCGKNTKKPKSFFILNGMKTVCGHCHSVYKLVRGSNIESVVKIINAMNTHSCVGCNHFNIDNIDYCLERMWTGMETHRRDYPLTYGYSRCSRFSQNPNVI